MESPASCNYRQLHCTQDLRRKEKCLFLVDNFPGRLILAIITRSLIRRGRKRVIKMLLLIFLSPNNWWRTVDFWKERVKSIFKTWLTGGGVGKSKYQVPAAWYRVSAWRCWPCQKFICGTAARLPRRQDLAHRLFLPRITDKRIAEMNPCTPPLRCPDNYQGFTVSKKQKQN